MAASALLRSESAASVITCTKPEKEHNIQLKQETGANMLMYVTNGLLPCLAYTGSYWQIHHAACERGMQLHVQKNHKETFLQAADHNLHMAWHCYSNLMLADQLMAVLLLELRHLAFSFCRLHQSTEDPQKSATSSCADACIGKVHAYKTPYTRTAWRCLATCALPGSGCTGDEHATCVWERQGLQAGMSLWPWWKHCCGWLTCSPFFKLVAGCNQHRLLPSCLHHGSIHWRRA